MFDVDGAASCGIFPIWYKGVLEKSNTYVPKRDYLEVDNWNELLELLGKNEG